MARLVSTVLAATTLIAVVPASAEALTPWSVRQVTRTAAVAPGQTAPLTLRCPRGYGALDGAVTALSAGVTTQRSVPSGRRAWQFAAANGGAAPGSFSAAVNCGRLRAPRGYRTPNYGLASRTGQVDIPAGATASLNVPCPRGRRPVGFGVEQAGQIDLRKARPNFPEGNAPGRWEFVIRNVGGGPVQARMVARCVLRRVSTPRVRLTRATRRRRAVKRIVEVRRLSRSLDLQPGNNDGITYSCSGTSGGGGGRGGRPGRTAARARTVAVATGHDFLEERAVLSTSWATPSTGGTWNIAVAPPAGGNLSTPVTLYVLCLDQGHRWK